MLNYAPEPTKEEILAALRADAAPPPLQGNVVGDDVLLLTEEVEQPPPQQPAPLPVEQVAFENVAPPAVAALLNGELMTPATTSLENVFERAVSTSFEPVLKGFLLDNFEGVLHRVKPLIREWMDEHFPALLEGAVRAEVERVIRAGGTRR